jgi:hypothetical protein
MGGRSFDEFDEMGPSIFRSRSAISEGEIGMGQETVLGAT